MIETGYEDLINLSQDREEWKFMRLYLNKCLEKLLLQPTLRIVIFLFD